MLPGLRFLFAASLTCASLLIFGMGAIALLRASHQQFASAPPGPPPEPVFAQAPQTVPSLSMLRVDPPVAPPTDTPRDPAPALERAAALTSAERASEPASQPSLEAPAPDTRSETSPVGETPPPPAAMPLTENTPDATSSVATATTPAADNASVLDAPDTTPAAEPARIASKTQTEPKPEPAATGSIAMPEDQPVVEQPMANPPLPEARPEVAAIPPKVEPAPARAKPKPITKRKVRAAKRAHAKTEKLPAVSSAPTLGSLFGSK